MVSEASKKRLTQLAIVAAVVAIIIAVVWFTVRRSRQSFVAAFNPHYTLQDCANYFMAIDSGYWEGANEVITEMGNLALPSDHTSSDECLAYWSNPANPQVF